MAFFTCLASVNLYMVSFSKMLHAMSLTGDLPAGLQLTNRHNVPVRAMAVCYGVVAGTLLLCYAIALPLEELILYANTVFVAVYLLHPWRALFCCVASGFSRQLYQRCFVA